MSLRAQRGSSLSDHSRNLKKENRGKARPRATRRLAASVRGGIEALEQRMLLSVVTTLKDPFTGTAVDTTKWTITNRGLENNGDAGYNAPTEDPATGLTLGGTTNNQYWYGKSLESVDQFSSSQQVTVSLDRVSLAGSGTAWRSSLWLLQPGGQFEQFAQNQGESGWEYNHTVGGSGVAIPAFNTAAGDANDHVMKMVYTPLGGTNASIDIYLDGKLGVTDTFDNWDNTVPFETIVTGQARATNDTVSAVFKNFDAEATPAATIPPAAPTNLAVTATGNQATLTWTDNADNELGYRVERATDPNGPFTQIASVGPVANKGGQGTYVDNGRSPAVTEYYRVRAFNNAGANSTTAFSDYSNVANVPATAQIITSLKDPLTGTAVDTTKWNITDRGLENNGPAGYDAPTEDPINGLTLGGTTTAQYWYGSSLESKGFFSSHTPTTVSVDRFALNGNGSAYRSSLWLLQPGAQFLHFAQDLGPADNTGWEYNQTGGGGGERHRGVQHGRR